MNTKESINDVLEKIKPIIKPFYVPTLILALASIFFAFGRLATLSENQIPIKIVRQDLTLDLTLTQKTDGSVIGSKSGKKYYFPWCGTVKRIKPENQVHFASVVEARKAGFVPGGNCKGLQ
jgi:hypothetical protein